MRATSRKGRFDCVMIEDELKHQQEDELLFETFRDGKRRRAIVWKSFLLVQNETFCI